MSYLASARSRWTVAGAALAATLLTTSVVLGSTEAVTAQASTGGDAAAARSSAALARGLAAQARATSSLTLLSETAPVATARKAPTTIAVTGATSWTRLPVVEPGASGPAVVMLQKKLKVKSTGWYGPMTLAAVVAFQTSRGLPAKGYVGKRTWQALFTPAPAAAPRVTKVGRSTTRIPTTGRICPAPGAAFGSGWGAQRAGHTHKGVDLVASRGSAIVAIESGVVIRAGRQSNGAIRLVIQGRSGSKFFYGHMDSISVRAGSVVARGEVIGRMGDTGSAGQVHLHFEYWKSGGESAAVDPYPLLKSLCW